MATDSCSGPANSYLFGQKFRILQQMVCKRTITEKLEMMERRHWINTTQARIAIAIVLICALALLQIYHAIAGTTPAACKETDTPQEMLTGHATDLSIVKQGYQCILSHYISARTLDDRPLLREAMQEIARALPPTVTGATLQGLSGNHDADWQIFAKTYNAIAGQLVQTTAAQQELSELALLGMTISLHDDHTAYLPPNRMKVELAQLNPTTPAPTLGIVTSPLTTTTPLYITDVLTHTPASAAGLRPGDIIEQVGGQPIFQQGQLTAAIESLLTPRIGVPISITVQRPSTGTTLSWVLQPKALVSQPVSARQLPGNIAYVRLYTFTSNAYSQVFAALKKLASQQALQGVVLDLRDNPGGDEDQAVQILSAFVHQKVIGYSADSAGHRDPIRTNNKVSLFNKPLAVLIDGGSASSSELVAAAVRDLHLGTVAGSRTAGALAAAYFYSLSDGSGLEITADRVLGALGEKVDGIGVPPTRTS